jgi:hypothetical protein
MTNNCFKIAEKLFLKPHQNLFQISACSWQFLILSFIKKANHTSENTGVFIKLNITNTVQIGITWRLKSRVK